MNNLSLSTATSPRPTDDAEVESQKGPSQEEVVLEEPQGDLPDSRRKGDETPKGSKAGPGPDTALEPSMVSEFGRRPPSKEGKPTMPVTSVQPETPDNLLEALRGASIVDEHLILMVTVIVDEHPILMVTVIERAPDNLLEALLTEACSSLQTGFEVSDAIL